MTERPCISPNCPLCSLERAAEIASFARKSTELPSTEQLTSAIELIPTETLRAAIDAMTEQRNAFTSTIAVARVVLGSRDEGKVVA